MIRRIRTSLHREHALRATRVSVGKNRLVYVLIADKRFSYGKMKSRICYIGTTRQGLARVASSVAHRADNILSESGVREFHARIITCKPRQKVKTWIKLERALLLEFRNKFGSVPICNVHGKGMREIDEFDYFSRSGIRNLIEELS